MAENYRSRKGARAVDDENGIDSPPDHRYERASIAEI